jgi:hypothetical protein
MRTIKIIKVILEIINLYGSHFLIQYIKEYISNTNDTPLSTVFLTLYEILDEAKTNEIICLNNCIINHIIKFNATNYEHQCSQSDKKLIQILLDHPLDWSQYSSLTGVSSFLCVMNDLKTDEERIEIINFLKEFINHRVSTNLNLDDDTNLIINKIVDKNSIFLIL